MMTLRVVRSVSDTDTVRTEEKFVSDRATVEGNNIDPSRTHVGDQMNKSGMDSEVTETDFQNSHGVSPTVVDTVNVDGGNEVEDQVVGGMNLSIADTMNLLNSGTDMSEVEKEPSIAEVLENLRNYGNLIDNLKEGDEGLEPSEETNEIVEVENVGTPGEKKKLTTKERDGKKRRKVEKRARKEEKRATKVAEKEFEKTEAEAAGKRCKKIEKKKSWERGS
ncbi:hypothetical protein LIER_43184 [Lithospermum erythrorhizon]|uniref:Uncharacterized protein n=1 Tax=Lithospermum erythrorhizon TaxID=34254 RepID=A0AAV3PMQ3_LITER